MTFSGSYAPQDVTFLLKPVQMASTPLELKEALLQSGRRHYSEMITAEPPPDEEYLSLFEDAFALSRKRLALDLASLATTLAKRIPGEIVVVSLARAGTPIGVLLRRALPQLGCVSFHYSISIIRGRGIDEIALDHILERHDPASLVFVDGWTGKGAVAAELKRAVEDYNRSHGVRLDPSLTVVSDLAGVAGLAASGDDYLIPCSILNAVISGLVSRTILHREHVGPGDFHACVFCEELLLHDRSRWFVDVMAKEVEAVMAEKACAPAVWGPELRHSRQETLRAFLSSVSRRYGIRDRNRVKPGLGEATRALLRRVPERILVQAREGLDLSHLLLLARRRGVAVEHNSDLPFRAVALLRSVRGER
jgi:hypothetical protein